MSNASYRSKSPKSSKANGQAHGGQDVILDALRDGMGDEPTFAASSSALQAANAVMLANMRARLGKDTPTPSAVYAAAMAQMQASPAAAAEPTPYGVALPAADAQDNQTATTPPAAPAEAAAEPKAPEAEMTAEEATATAEAASAGEASEAGTTETMHIPEITAPDKLEILPSIETSPFSPLHSRAETQAEGSTILAVEHAPSSTPDISPAAARSERSETPGPRNWISFGRKPSEPETPAAATPDMPAAEPAMPPNMLEQDEKLDTDSYARESDAAYRDWQGALPPAQRSWHKGAMLAVLALAVGINAFFFLRSGPDGPSIHTPGTAPVAPLSSAEAPARDQAALATLFPQDQPAASENAAISAQPEPVASAPIPLLPESAAPKATAPKAPAKIKPTVKPAQTKPAPAAKPVANTGPAPIDPQQLLRIVSRP